MPKKVKVTELLNPQTFEKHKEDLVHYFGNGGTWQDLLGYGEDVMRAHYEKAYQFYQQGQFKEAGACFSYLTMINPYRFNYWMGLGMAKQSQLCFEEAVVSYTTAGAIEPNNPLPPLHLAQCYNALQLSNLAVEQLKDALNTTDDKPASVEGRKKAHAILRHMEKQ